MSLEIKSLLARKIL